MANKNRVSKKTLASEMRRTWLVQRLDKPSGGWLGMTDNPFSFGGGLRNGGLSNGAMDLLRGIFSFDYMGAAEFEFGAVPEALRSIAQDARHLTTSTFTIPLSEVQADWRDKGKPAPDGEGTVYLLCRGAHQVEAEQRIRSWAAKDYQLKESVNLCCALRPRDDYDRRTCGWLELNNGFFFFTDRDMWAATASLFGVSVPVSVSS